MYFLSFPKSLLLVLLCMGCLATPARCQIGIDQDQPHPTSVLDIKGTAKGVLIPRMTAAERLSITVGQSEGQKANSLLVFDSTYQRYFHLDKYLRKDWLTFFPTRHMTDPANPGVYAGDVFEGKLGIGTTAAPTERLEVAGNVKVTGSLSTGEMNAGSLSTGEMNAGNATVTNSITVKGNLTAENNVNVTGNVTAFRFVGDGVIPAGGIIMWNGTIPPDGWALCDGTNGTPDLRGRFIVGYNPADPDYNGTGKTGGEKSHTLTIAEMPAHTHGLKNYIPDRQYNEDNDGKIQIQQDVASTANFETDEAGGSQPHENRPPYYVLAFIIKL